MRENGMVLCSHKRARKGREVAMMMAMPTTTTQFRALPKFLPCNVTKRIGLRLRCTLCAPIL